jgi:hypothetical protein
LSVCRLTSSALASIYQLPRDNFEHPRSDGSKLIEQLELQLAETGGEDRPHGPQARAVPEPHSKTKTGEPSQKALITITNAGRLTTLEV